MTDSGSPFERLTPALQYQIVNGLGFRELRPVQLNAIQPIVDGHNCVVLAPTAGGKTEAAFFPLLSEIERHDARAVAALYVAPIVALLNNQETRLSHYAGLIGRRAFKWHGDTSPSQRKAFMREPADILLTTPESLEVMLMSKNVPARRLFAHLRAVVIDEVHAFVGDDRGGHLSSVLERLTRIAGHDVQRIGLSATVGNPEDILRWLRGSSQRPGQVLYPVGTSKLSEQRLDYVGTLENAATVIANLHAGEKRLVFVDSRRGVESLGKMLIAQGVDAHVTHSSLSRDQRKLAERAFEDGQNCVIVATSALELGVDIGDLDRVIQIDAPATVAGFLQRMGRTGRRSHTSPNCLFLTTKDEALVQAAALLHLHGQGYVEPVPVHTRAAHLLAHQIMALSLQEDGIPRADYWAWLSAATPFQGLGPEDRNALLEHMLSEAILHEAGGKLSLGERGQKLYGRKNFAELYTVFSAPRTLAVMYGQEAVGQIDANFAQAGELANLTFTLAARAWRARHVDFSRAILHAEPAESGALARWQGQPALLGRPLCEAIRHVLTATEEPSHWSTRAVQRMRSIRVEYAFLRQEGTTLASEATGFRLWTFYGGKANNLLAKVLEQRLGEKVTTNNLSLGFKQKAGESEVAIRQALDELRAEGRPNDEDAARFAELCARGPLTKFEPCLPEHMLAAHLAEKLTELPW